MEVHEIKTLKEKFELEIGAVLAAFVTESGLAVKIKGGCSKGKPAPAPVEGETMPDGAEKVASVAPQPQVTMQLLWED